MQALSRKEIIESVKLSLINLGLEYIDLVIVHKYDHNCPVEGNNYNGPSINDVSSEGKHWEDFHKIRCLLISFRYLHSFFALVLIFFDYFSHLSSILISFRNVYIRLIITDWVCNFLIYKWFFLTSCISYSFQQ